MDNITTFEQADAQAKKLIPTRDSIEATVVNEPKVYDSKTFWLVTFVKADTKEPTQLFGAIQYIAGNGKLISFSSNPLITPFEKHEELLLAEFDK